MAMTGNYCDYCGTKTLECNEKWTKEDVNKKLKDIMTKAFNEVWEISKKYEINLRMSAFVLALKRLEKSIKL